MTQIKHEWREYLAKINYNQHSSMTDGCIDKMLFRSGNERLSLLKFVVFELSGKETDGSNEKLLQVLCRHVYIPKIFQTAFIEGNMVKHKQMQEKIWAAIFIAIIENKSVNAVSEENNSLILDNNIDLLETNFDSFIKNTLYDDCNKLESKCRNTSGDTDQLISQWESLSNQVNNIQSSVINETSIAPFSFYVNKFMEFIDNYRTEVGLGVVETSDTKCNPELEALNEIIPSLSSTYLFIEKFYEDKNQISKCIKKSDKCQMNQVNFEIFSSDTRLSELYNKLFSLYTSANSD